MTEVIDGQTYMVFDVDNDTTLNKIFNFCENNLYVKLVLQTDRIKPDAYEYWGGHESCIYTNKIIDLNGHVLSLKQFDTNERNLEICDSSVAQTGQIICTEKLLFQNPINVILRGGTLQAPLIQYNSSFGYNCSYNFYGARVICDKVVSYDDTVFNVLPYMEATYDENGRVLTVEPKYDHLAVSTSDMVSGAYNSAYGVAWDMDVAALNRLQLAADQTYYLWARNADGWYEFLNLRCSDGRTWQKCA